MISEAEAFCFYEVGDYENALCSYKEAAAVIELFWDREIPAEYTLLQSRDVPQGYALVGVAACLFRLGRVTECEETLDKAYHLVRDGYSDELWKQCKEIRHRELRRLYARLRLDDYTACPY